MIDSVPEELWLKVCNIVQEAVIKTIPKKRKCKKWNGCLRRLNRYLRKEEKRKLKIYCSECRVPENSKERQEDLFLYSSSLYSCHLFLISYASVRSLLFLSFIMPILAWNVPLTSLVLLKRSLVPSTLFFSQTSLKCSCKSGSQILWGKCICSVMSNSLWPHGL